MSDISSNSPLYDSDNFQIPKDRIEMNAWNRHYYTSNPLIADWIDLISLKVYGQFIINGSPEYTKAFFDKDGWFKYDRQMRDAVKELNIIGEVVPYLILDEENGTFNLILNDPDYIQVKNNGLQEGIVVSMQPDAELRRLVVSDKDEDKKIVDQIDLEIVSLIKDNKLILLHPTYVSHLSMKNSPYDIRGTSIITKHLRTLLLEDHIQELVLNEGKSIERTILLADLRREVKSEAFEKKLYNQRYMLQDFIEKKVLAPFGRLHDIPGEVSISWSDPIDTKDFVKLFQN